MPRRDNRTEGATLRPPKGSRAKPNAASVGRNNPYQGNVAFASSSSSSLNALNRAIDWNDGNAFGVGTMSSTGATMGAAEAPFLATAESHLGRMTLTAPDNMRRRKAEEKEKRRNVRKAKIERLESNAAHAAAALLGEEERRSISPAQRMLASASSASAERRAAIPTTRSSSNLQTLRAVEVQRSRSPTRPPRPRSAQNAARSDTSPERRPAATTVQAVGAQTRRARRQRQAAERPAQQRQTSGSETGARSRQLSRSSSMAEQSAGEEQSAVRAEALRRATRRRRDIYADLSTMNLPGMSDSETEESPPPPFPVNATRPLSPPTMPVEGQEWTEEMRRRQEEYLNNLPPNSPPPAFLSEDENSSPAGRQSAAVPDRESSVEAVSSEDESGAIEMDEDRQLWEADVLAGYSFEERLERERHRREQKESEEQRDQHPSHTVPEATLPSGELVLPQVEDVQRDVDVEPVAEVVEALPNVDLGQLVIEARARREAVEAVNKADSLDEAAAVNTVQPQTSHVTPPRAVIVHRRTASNENRSRGAASPKTSRNVNAAIGTGKGLVDGNKHRVTPESHGKPTTIRPRPASESHSRFRDAASAAAARRQALWESMRERSLSSSVVQAAPASSSAVVLPSVDMESRRRDAPPLQRKDTVSSLGETDEDYQRESSDSEAEWQKEENQILQMQRSTGSNAQAVESSDEDEDEDEVPLPGSMPSKKKTAPTNTMADLPELGRVGRSVPRAPPPLVLGRSRGGAAYSSSSESSNSSEERRARDEADDTDSESPIEHEESAPSDSDRFSASHGRPSIDKGKQPVRPTDALRSTDESPVLALNERAGVFIEQSGSSRDVSADEDEVGHDTVRQRTASSSTQHSRDDKQRVQNRLRDLFATQLDREERSINVSSVSPRVPPKNAEDDPIRNSARGREQQETSYPLPRRSPMVNEIGNVGTQRTMTAEEARAGALDSISQVQRSRSRLPEGVDRDSLAALERMLSRSGAYTRPSAPSRDPEQPLANEPSKLTRSGAISNRQMSSSSFVNPRSVNAPRPLGRLPTITDATRHFPPSQAPSADAEHAENERPRARLPRRSVATPSWMAYVPANERRALPEPLQPDVRHGQGFSSGSRVSAMVQRFDGQRPGMPTPTQGQFEQAIASPSTSNHIDTLRRRPPPPPPPSSWRRAKEVLNSTTGPGSDDVLPGARVLSGNTTSSASTTIAEPGPSDTGDASNTTISPAISIFGNLYTSEDISRSSNNLFRTSRPLPIPPHYDPNALTFAASAAPAQPGTSAEERSAQEGVESIESDSVPVCESPVEEEIEETSPTIDEEEVTESGPTRVLSRRDPSLGITDLDIFASRLADARNAQDATGGDDGQPADEQGGDQYDDLHLLAEFLGPAKQPGLTQDEMEALPVGRVEILRRRIVGKRDDGRDKVKLVLAVAGVKVERCAVCLVQFKENNMACVFPCLHVLHEQCASKLLRSTTLCPTCRSSVVER